MPRTLIILDTPKGPKKLFGIYLALCPRITRRNSWQADCDYVRPLLNKIAHSDQKIAAEATNALLWLDAYLLAELQGDFKAFEEVGVELTTDQKKRMWTSRNAAYRDLINQSHISSRIDSTDIRQADIQLTARSGKARKPKAQKGATK